LGILHGRIRVFEAGCKFAREVAMTLEKLKLNVSKLAVSMGMQSCEQFP